MKPSWAAAAIASLVVSTCVEAGYFALEIQEKTYNGTSMVATGMYYFAEQGSVDGFATRSCSQYKAEFTRGVVGIQSRCDHVKNQIGLKFPSGYNGTFSNEVYDAYTNTFHPCGKGFTEGLRTMYVCGPISPVYEHIDPNMAASTASDTFSGQALAAVTLVIAATILF